MSIKIPAKVEARIHQQLKKYQAAVLDATKRDVNESDTAILVADILCDVFGYKKIEEISTEHSIRGQFADLIVKVGSVTRFLVEVKAINIELKEAHISQVVNYAANAPADWVILTNAVRWQAYKVTFGKPIDRTLVLDVDLCKANLKDPDLNELFGALSREVFTPDSMSQMFRSRQAMSKYSIAQLLLSEPVVGMVRRELRKLADGLNPNIDDVRAIIEEQVIKRELLEADAATVAAKAVKKLAKQARAKRANDSAEPAQETPTNSDVTLTPPAK